MRLLCGRLTFESSRCSNVCRSHTQIKCVCVINIYIKNMSGCIVDH